MLCVCVFVWLILSMCGCGLDSGGRTLIMGFRAVQSGSHIEGRREEGWRRRTESTKISSSVWHSACPLSRYTLSLLLYFRLSSNWLIICIWSNKYRTRDRKVRLVNSWEHPRLRYKAGHRLLLSKHISFPCKDLYLSNTHLVLHHSLLNEQLKKHSAGKSSLLKSVWRFIC